MENVIQLLEERGMIELMTTPELREFVKNPLRIYCGFDPTADSLHVGNMVPMMALLWFQRCGHTPFVLVGGATGMIGDPSGKATERALLDEEQLRKNCSGIETNLRPFFTRDSKYPAPHFLNNYDWFKDFSFISFLRDVGKHFRVGVMLGKESVRARMQSEEGMSFTEFSYQLLQAYDFYHLFQTYGVTVELGGTDQWGNITAGCELIRKLTGASVHGLTVPLLTKSDGTKFGKSEKGAIWLSAEKLSPYDFYQQLVRVDDRDVIKLMKMLTFIDMTEIRRIEQAMKEPEYVPNTAQKRLAHAVTEIIHGEEGVTKAIKATELAEPGKCTRPTAEQLALLLQEVTHVKLPYEQLIGKKLIDVIAIGQLLPSKGECRRLIRNNGLFVNGERVDTEDYTVAQSDLIGEKFILLALGKKNKAIVEAIA